MCQVHNIKETMNTVILNATETQLMQRLGKTSQPAADLLKNIQSGNSIKPEDIRFVIENVNNQLRAISREPNAVASKFITDTIEKRIGEYSKLLSDIDTKIEENFPILVNAAINKAVHKAVVQPLLDFWKKKENNASDVKSPCLLGPSGTGKTYGIRSCLKLAFENYPGNPGFYEFAMGPASSSADAFGIVLPSGTGIHKIWGDLALACERGANGEKILFLFDEFFRSNLSLQEVLMSFLIPLPAEHARAMGINYQGSSPIFTGQAPVFGRIWCPVENIKFVFAGNSWGNPIDPAFANRLKFIRAGFDTDVANLFKGAIKDAILGSWENARSDSAMQIPMAISYRNIAMATSPTDKEFIRDYVDQLYAISPESGEAYANKFCAPLGLTF